MNSLVALRQIVHALRGWPTPFGLALNVGGGLNVNDPRIMASIDVIAGQILGFTSASSSRERGGWAEARGRLATVAVFVRT